MHRLLCFSQRQHTEDGLPVVKQLLRQYYEDGIRADMDNYALYLSKNLDPFFLRVSVAEQDAYLAQPGVAYNATDALELINTQYWIANLRNGAEAWANFRRSGYPCFES